MNVLDGVHSSYVQSWRLIGWGVDSVRKKRVLGLLSEMIGKIKSFCKITCSGLSD